MTYAKFAVVLLGTTALIPISAMAQTNNQAPQPGAQGKAAAGPTAQAQAGQQGLPAGQLQNQPLYTQAGQEFGRVHSVVRDQQARTFLVVLHGEGHYLVPAEQLRYANNRFVLAGMTGQERLQPYTPPVAANHETLGADQRIAVAGYGAQTQQAEASRLVIQQRAPAVQFQQAAPQITVRQPEPSVTVDQPQPEILVQQPPPTIRVELPQPQITVRMPKPDVNVAMAQPQVQVRQPQPQVQVQRAQGEAQVQVQREQPQVQVQRAQGEPQVQVQQGQPVVRYERTGEPKVIYNQAPGQPVVRIEEAAQKPEAQAQTGSTTPAAGQRQSMTEQERQRAQQRLIVEDDNAAANQANVQTRPVAIGDLDDMEVYNARGERLGEVGRVVLDPRTNRRYVVVEQGGFLGIGRDRVAFPIERFWMRGDRLVLRGVTPQDIEEMDHYRDQIQNYQRVADTDRVDLRLWD